MISLAQIDHMTDAQFEHEVFALIAREYGIAGLARFIRLHHSGPGDYTADRQKWQTHTTIEDSNPSALEHK